MIAPRPPERKFRRIDYLVIAVVVLLVATAFGIVALEPPGSGNLAACSISWSASPATQTPIKHLFILIKENHAFENYFGSLPGVLGYPPNGSLPVAFHSSQVVHPFPLTGDSTGDFPHTKQADQTDLNGGANNLFVAEANASGVPNPQDAAGYYTAQQLPDYFDYAQYYGLGDRFFTGVLGPTEPNRVFDLSAYVGSWNADSTPPANVTDHPTVLDQLTSQGISWNYDYAGASANLAVDLFPTLRDSACNSARIAPTSDLAAQLSQPTAPSVVYIDPSNSMVYSEHPPESVSLGENWTVAAINTILTSPVANSSAILFFYDENGGFWDPIAPPTTSTGPDGFRVPLLVLSPWTPAGTICSTSLDPASVLQFIDSNWGLPFLNSRVASAPDLSCFFHFSIPPRSPLLLSTNVTLTGSSPPPASHSVATISSLHGGFGGVRSVRIAAPQNGSSRDPVSLARWMARGSVRALHGRELWATGEPTGRPLLRSREPSRRVARGPLRAPTRGVHRVGRRGRVRARVPRTRPAGSPLHGRARRSHRASVTGGPCGSPQSAPKGRSASWAGDSPSEPRTARAVVERPVDLRIRAQAP